MNSTLPQFAASYEADNPLESIGKLFSTLCVAVIGLLSRGLAIATLWNWFVVPLNVPHLTVIWAMGLSITASLFVTDITKGILETQKNQQEWGTQMAYSLIVSYVIYPIVIALGWIIHSLT